MRKIPTLFKRDFTNGGKITREYAEGTDWVKNGEGVATRKYDGTSVLIRGGKMYKRYELRPGKIAPTDFEAVDTDEVTGKTVGWVQVGWGGEDKWHRDALKSGDPDKVDMADGTYELIGPKVQGNPEHEINHVLLPHASAEQYPDAPRTYDELQAWLAERDIEGLVWHHPDGRMVKIKKKDFGQQRQKVQEL